MVQTLLAEVVPKSVTCARTYHPRLRPAFTFANRRPGWAQATKRAFREDFPRPHP